MHCLAGCKGGHLVAAVAASYLQYQGTTQGFWFDPDKLPWLDPLVDNPGFEAALKFWRDLEPYTNPMKTCNVVNSDFQAGRCFFTINWCVIAYSVGAAWWRCMRKHWITSQEQSESATGTAA